MKQSSSYRPIRINLNVQINLQAELLHLKCTTRTRGTAFEHLKFWEL